MVATESIERSEDLGVNGTQKQPELIESYIRDEVATQLNKEHLPAEEEGIQGRSEDLGLEAETNSVATSTLYTTELVNGEKSDDPDEGWGGEL